MATTSRSNAARIGSGNPGVPGHTHDMGDISGGGGGGGVTDHGALTGLGDDDHTQYLNNSRGDVRYDAKNTASTAVAAHVALADPHTQYLKPTEVIAGTNVTVNTTTTPGSVIVSSTAAGGGGVTDHGALTGLGDDDHPQYLKPSEVKAGSAITVDVNVNGEVTISSAAAGGGSVPTGGSTGQALVKTSATDYATGWTTIAGSTTLQSQIELDSMVGATDDDKLTNAMSAAAAQNYPPPILLGPKNYNFSANRALYDGFTLIGVQGMGNAELGNRGTMRTQVSVSGSGTWLSANGGIRKASENWDVAIRNISFTGSSGKQFMGGAAVLWCMNLRDCSWSGWSSVLGSQATKLLVNLCLFDGWLSFHNSYHGEIHIGGSDNTLFVAMTNIDGNIGYLSPGGSTGQAHLWLDYMEKTTIGPIYSTGEGGWTCIRVTGPAFNTVVGQNGNLGGPIWITGAKLEGRNITDACNGSIIRVEGGQLHLRDTWVSYGMKNPTAMGHSPTDAGMIHQTGGQLLVDGCTYDRATGVLETVPFVYSAGGKARVSNIFTGSKGQAWTGLPRVDSAGGTVTADTSVTVI